jgi:type II secretory pathway pseudopilin PulG
MWNLLNKIKIANSNDGITLLETVLSIAILGLLGLGIMGAIVQFQTRTDLDAATLTGVDGLRRARSLSRAVLNDSSWGVKFATGTITIFKGASFAARDASFDEELDINPDISILNSDEFVFARFGATTTASATTTLFHAGVGASNTISVTSGGVINY